MTANMSQARIQLHLDVHEPIELMDLTLSFQALSFEYRKQLFDRARSRGNKPDEAEVKLYITKIESNCILAEIGSAVAIMGTLFSLADYVNIFIDFTNHIKNGIEYFKGIGSSGEVDPQKIKYTKAECGRFADLLDVVAKNKTGNLGISVIEYDDEHTDSKVHLSIGFSSEEAYTARKGALIAQKSLEYKGEAEHRSVLMYFYQTNIDDPKSVGRTGDKAIIRAISGKPLPVYFVSEMDQQKIAYTVSDPAVNPFKASYIVDVNVETDRNDVPRFYRIVRVIDIIPGEDAENDSTNSAQ
jgi:hypothetical protein